MTYITSPSSHATFTSHAESTGQPTVLYVCNPHLPACKTFTPLYTILAERYQAKHDIGFAQMDLSSETSMLFKFAPNQLPVMTFMCRQGKGMGKEEGKMWAKTIMGADLREVERGVEEMLRVAGLGSE